MELISDAGARIITDAWCHFSVLQKWHPGSLIMELAELATQGHRIHGISDSSNVELMELATHHRIVGAKGATSFFSTSDTLKPRMMLVSVLATVHTHTEHASTDCRTQSSEEVGESLPELDTEDVRCRGYGLKFAFAHPFSVKLIQLLLGERTYLPFETGGRLAVRRILAIAVCIRLM